MAVKNLTTEQIKFIHENNGKMKQKDIARVLGITPPAVSQRINKRVKVVEGFFDIDELKKQYLV